MMLMSGAPRYKGEISRKKKKRDRKMKERILSSIAGAGASFTIMGACMIDSEGLAGAYALWSFIVGFSVVIIVYGKMELDRKRDELNKKLKERRSNETIIINNPNIDLYY